MSIKMKYLKKFLITEKVNIDNLQKFCDDSLAFIIDEGFNIYINEFTDYISILLKNDNNLFKWDDYKNDIIPFIEYLYEKYDCEERICFFDKYDDSHSVKIANPKLGYYNKTELKPNYLESLEIEIDYMLKGIFFYIKLG